MPNVLVVSDHHFDHANILNFKKPDGSPLRVFKDVSHMNEYMVERHNSIVRPQDKVYFLGDVAIKDTGINYLKRLNGHKRLILGNHDYANMRLYQPYFEAIYSSRMLDKMLFTHIPVHPLSLGKAIANVHGHTHAGLSDDHFGKQYFNVCVEVLDYTPISLEDLKKKVIKKLSS